MRLAVVIPCYRVKSRICDVLQKIGPEVHHIIVIDDCCPEQSGKTALESCSDPRLQVIFHSENRGVGGATVSGYRAALELGADIVVKVDGDGQMDPRQISRLVHPIASGQADYTKGNRFYNLESLRAMPVVRLFGNSILSFLSKATTGYWNLMDPTNGFTAAASSVLQMLPLNKLDQRYFFESDMLFRLNTIRAVVREVPMDAIYAGEESSLNIIRTCFSFPGKFAVRFLKRLFYNYFLRDFNVCSLELLIGFPLLFFGIIFGAVKWYSNYTAGVATPTGTIMLAVLPVILGFQLLMEAVTFDVLNVPRQPLREALK